MDFVDDEQAELISILVDVPICRIIGRHRKVAHIVASPTVSATSAKCKYHPLHHFMNSFLEFV